MLDKLKSGGDSEYGTSLEGSLSEGGKEKAIFAPDDLPLYEQLSRRLDHLS